MRYSAMVAGFGFCVALASAVSVARTTPFEAQQPVPSVPDWVRTAGGTMSFEVASIRASKPETSIRPTFPLSADDAFQTPDGKRPTGGRLIADFQLMTYIGFAYKIQLSPEERQAVLSQLPKWAANDKFTIQAKAPVENPTKDQMRLMMQALLADHFRLAIHFERRELPALALVLAQPGKLGPQLRPHFEGSACDAPAIAFPEPCDVFSLQSQAGKIQAGSRNNTIDV